MKGKYTLQSVYVNVLMAVTPSRFCETVTPEDIASGFLARFLPVLVTRDIARKPLTTLPPEVATVGTALAEELKAMHARMGSEPKALPISPEAIARLDRAEEALETWAGRQYQADLIMPWARRLAEYAARLTIIFAVSEGVEEAGLPQVLRAVDVVNRAKDDVKALVEELVKGQAARKRDRYERYIREHPGLSGRDLQRATGDDAREARAIVSELQQQERIHVEWRDNGSRYTCWPPAVESSDVGNVIPAKEGEGVGLSGVGIVG